MESLGIDFSSSGSVMNKDQLEEQRRKRGQCLTCGQKCFQKKLFKLIPIDDHGKVLNGRCLKCKPLEARLGETIPAVSRPATSQDMERFKRSQSSVLVGPGVKPMDTKRTPSLNLPSSSASADSIGARSAPVQSRYGSGSSTISDENDDDYDNASLKSRESGTPPPRRPRRIIASGLTRSGLRRGENEKSSRSVDSTKSSASSGFATQTVPMPPPPIIEGVRKGPREEADMGEQVHKAALGAMAAHQLKTDVRSRRKPPPQTAKRLVASIPSDNLSTYHDEADLENSVGSRRSRDRSNPNSAGNSLKADEEYFNVRPVHGLLNRGGTMRFEGHTMMQDPMESGTGSKLPFSPMNHTESSRTMSSISSMEDDCGMNGRQRSWKRPPQYSNSRKSAVFEDEEDSFHSSLSKSSRNTSSRSKTEATSKRQEQERLMIESLTSEDDFVVIVDAMKANKHSGAVQQEALKCLSNLQLSNVQYAEIYTAGALETSVLAMRNHPHNLDLQNYGCRAIWNLSATPQNQLKLVANGALDVILSAMASFPDDSELQEKAMAALSNLGAAERNQDRFMESEVVEKIVETMNRLSDDSHVQAKACAAITNFASYDSPLKRKIMECGGGGAVVISMIMHPDDVDLQEKALRALRNICANSEANKVEVAGVGGIDAVISAMQVHRDEPGVQEAGAWTLSNLAVNPENKAVIGDSGGIDVIIRAMWVHSEHVGVQEWCCRALWTLSVDAQNRQIMMEVGGISAVINCMQAHADAATVQEKGCGVLSNLAATDESCKIRIVEEEALDAIVMAMVLHADNCSVQDRACSVLKRLAITPNLKPMQAANVAELVRQAGEKFPDRCGEKSMQILSLI